MQKPIAIGDYVRQTSCPCDRVPDRDGLREVRFISYFCSCFQKFESIVVEEHGGTQRRTLSEFKNGWGRGKGGEHKTCTNMLLWLNLFIYALLQPIGQCKANLTSFHPITLETLSQPEPMSFLMNPLEPSQFQ